MVTFFTLCARFSASVSIDNKMTLPRRSSSGNRNGSGSTGGDEDGQEEAETNIKVAVRCRPMSTSERSRGEQSCFRIENGTACLENPFSPGDVHRQDFARLGNGDRLYVRFFDAP